MATIPINDGDAAFPRPYSVNPHNREQYWAQEGMSKREVFACHALPAAIQETGSMSAKMLADQGYDTWEDAAAAMSYRFADAMLRARNQQPEENDG